ncbi:uncharacterized protein BCR38DRAFT_130468 [Pseudomassariella vexata]|uniref:Tyrosinase copper-binding domain-containing protein n=1 Tax=Pseudomassariella vexata TaxID=1141098 RepID=A0A1Y2EAK7_9PEZI|nr:uncharacterized protein BCR38DRAFT_130468 [Pseudomassariella vexata]ORY68344.1 hypothetical protein BCR38DRAFT_130468 [Pseudomassariella vexata]
MDSPSKIPAGDAPGAKSRYDDFVAIHVNQTETIHFTGSFLSWHRYYMYSFERALRDECGYAGYLPYWNWGKTSKDPMNSPHMNGDQYSQGGNGIWAPHNCTSPVPGCEYCIPVVEGRGGGCVETGPYVGRMCNISATSPSLVAPDAPVAGTKLSYAPRCIRRDISPNITATFSTDAKHLDLLTNPLYQDSIGPYQDRLQGKPFDQCDPGQHGAGYFTWAADPGGDVYNTPNDPLFWLHHGGIDRSWWIWQNQKPTDRAFMIDGTLTLLNDPPSRNATVEDILDLMYAAPADTPPFAIKNHVSSVAGPYCYIYL